MAFVVYKERSLIAFNPVSWFSSEEQILYLLKLINAKHVQIAAALKKSRKVGKKSRVCFEGL